MSGFPIVDLVIGMIFLFFMLSIISSSVIEMILTGLKARAKILEEWLMKIFDKPVSRADGSTVPLGQAIMDHCSITALSKPGNSTSYIDAKNFTSALIEKITYNPEDPKSIATNIDELIAAVDKTPILATEFKRVLLTYANEAKDTYKALSEKTVSEVELFRTKIENWYDTCMDRITGTLKTKYSRPYTFIVAIIVAVSLNADSIAIAKYLYSNPEARARIAAKAMDVTADSNLIRLANQKPATSKGDSLTMDEIRMELSKRMSDINEAKAAINEEIPFTWKREELQFKNEKGNFSILLLFSKITGLLVTVFAIFMGAPFWFELLNKIANIRGTGKKPAQSTSEDDKKKIY